MATSLFQCVIDCWGVCLNTGAILSCNVVAHMDSVVVLIVYKQVEGKIMFD